MKWVFLGPPGAGKGTQAERLACHLRVPRLTTGDLLRSAIKEETPLGKKARNFVDQGRLVPDEVILGVMAERMERSDCKKGWLLDGFPRTVKQAEGLDGWLQERGEKLSGVLLLDVPLSVAVERLTGRRQCEKCGLSFHLAFQPSKKKGVCDACGGSLVLRSDDAPEAVETRLKVYENQTRPLVAYYQKVRLLQRVDGTQGPEEVFRTICSLIDGNK